MIRAVAILALFALPSVAFAQESIADRLARLESIVFSAPPVVKPVEPSYAAAVAQAQRQRLPLVVFVSVPSRVISDAITVSVSALPDGTRNAIVVSQDGVHGDWLPSTATNAEIMRRLAVKAAPAPFDPFSSLNQRSTAAAGADGRVGKTGGLRFDPSHNCPNCKAEQRVISYYVGNGNMHVHTCRKCGQQWVH